MELIDAHSFQELLNRLADLADQESGERHDVCQTGDAYVEFFSSGIARPDDVMAVEREVALNMWRQLYSYLSPRSGRIYWRVPFEHQVIEHAEIVRFDDAGTEFDFVSNRTCVKDHNWRRICCYCRLYRAVA